MSNWARAGQITVECILGGVGLFLYLLFASWIGGRLHEADVNQQAEVERLRGLMAIAETIEAAPEPEKSRLVREVELGKAADIWPPRAA
jgi:hypothetical protein